MLGIAFKIGIIVARATKTPQDLCVSINHYLSVIVDKASECRSGEQRLQGIIIGLGYRVVD
jgi:hypothetical protein